MALVAPSLFANNTPTFGETQTLLSGEDVRHFELKDLNGDYRLDLVWLTSDGQIKYKLHDNKAFENFESLQGTKWLLTFTSTGKNQWLTFENNGGLVETENNRQWNIVRYDVTDNGLHTFCTAYSSGLNGTDCYYKYTIESFENNKLSGTYVKSNEPWTAVQILN